MKIFITGASGFIGRNLLPVLRGHDLLCLSHSQVIQHEGQNIKVVTGDLDKPESYTDALDQFRPDCCIHLAWHGLPDYSVENSAKNLVSGISLVENLVKVGCKKVFIIGSCWEYGSALGAVSENDESNELAVFASFKTSLRIISDSICRESNTTLVWGRAFFVYGSGQRMNALIPTCYRDFKNREEPRINNPLARNDFVHISDVVDSIRVLVESEESSGIYNIGSGVSSAVWEVVNMVASELGLPLPYKDMPITLDGNFANMARMREHNWVPKMMLAQGISGTVKKLDSDL